MMKVTNKPGLDPNNGLPNAFLSDQSMASNPREGQAKRAQRIVGHTIAEFYGNVLVRERMSQVSPEC